MLTYLLPNTVSVYLRIVFRLLVLRIYITHLYVICVQHSKAISCIGNLTYACIIETVIVNGSAWFIYLVCIFEKPNGHTNHIVKLK